MKDVHSLVLYDDNDQPLFAFYSDLGGLIKYAFAQDEEFADIVRLAAGYTPTNIPAVSDLNITPIENSPSPK
jgi:hypothetical protein